MAILPLERIKGTECGLLGRMTSALHLSSSGTGTSGQADTAEEVGLDRTHPQEASIEHYTQSPDQEPSGKEEEMPATQQLEAIH